MPIITLYGAKGGTGRTTSAAALALGFLSTGKYVNLIDATKDEPWLSSWIDKAQDRRHPNYRIGAMQIGGPNEFLRFLRNAPKDPDQTFIIDTTKHPSVARRIALEVADVVVVPFRHFLDAETAVQRAASDIPHDQQIVGLSLSACPELKAKVSNWMPMLNTDLMWDDRLDLFGEDTASIMDDAMHLVPHELMSHKDISRNLGALATEVEKRLGVKIGKPNGPLAVPALIGEGATLRQIA